MFIGRADAKCTTKNQITFPSKFRAQIGDKLFITNWFENCLIVLSFKDGKNIMNLLTNEASSLLPETRALERFLFGGAEEIRLDQEGRFTLPAHLREYANIKEAVVFKGVGERIELWDKDIFGKYGYLTDSSARQIAISLYQKIQELKR